MQPTGRVAKAATKNRRSAGPKCRLIFLKAAGPIQATRLSLAPDDSTDHPHGKEAEVEREERRKQAREEARFCFPHSFGFQTIS